MKILKHEWLKFVIWTTILAAIVRASERNFSLETPILTGIIFGSIIYGIWYALIGRRRKSLQDSSQAPQSKWKRVWNAVKENLKILGFILLFFFIVGILISMIVPLLIRSR
jgi:Trk-type K+ transport system membrane component